MTTLRYRIPALLLALNWMLLLVAFIRTCRAQENVLWWLRLDWTGWMGELSELAQLGTLSADTVWILWLLCSLIMTGAWMLYPRQPAGDEVTDSSADTARKQLSTPSSMMDSNPALREKMLRLHQSLEKI